MTPDPDTTLAVILLAIYAVAVSAAVAALVTYKITTRKD